jgi:ABC-type sugar transport system substrate-binding protein
MLKERAVWLAVAGVVSVLSVAGCGSDSEADKGSTKVIGASKSEEVRSDAAAAGEKAATEAGAQVALPPQTLGILAVNNAAEAVQRMTQGASDAATELGWKVKVCDGAGDPKKMANCASTLLTQGSTVVASLCIESAGIKPQLEQAKKKNVLWMNYGCEAAPSPLFASQITYDEKTFGTQLGEYVKEQLGGEGEVAATTWSALPSLKLRADSALAVLRGAPAIDVVNVHDTNITTPADDAQKWTGTILTRYPDLKAIVLDSDIEAVGAAPVLKQKFPDKSFPDRPLLVAYFGNLGNLDLIRKGQLDAAAEIPVEAAGWMTVDRAAEFFARDQAPPERGADRYPFDFLGVQVVTKDNLPADPKSYVEPDQDFVSFFKAKWEKEFK